MSDSNRDRHRAKLQLLDAVHALVVHELGNPLQAMLVLLELTRGELEAEPSHHRGVLRLDRALASVERLRRVLMASSQLRVEGDARFVSLGAVLDGGLLLLDRRLEALEVEIARNTGALDDAKVPPALAQALVSVLIGVSEQLRGLREAGPRLELGAEASDRKVALRIGLRGPKGGGGLELDPALVATARDLVEGVAGCSCELDAGALILVSELEPAPRDQLLVVD